MIVRFFWLLFSLWLYFNFGVYVVVMFDADNFHMKVCVFGFVYVWMLVIVYKTSIVVSHVQIERKKRAEFNFANVSEQKKTVLFLSGTSYNSLLTMLP